jgi:hypothetical protein
VPAEQSSGPLPTLLAKETVAASPFTNYCGSATISIDYAPYTAKTLAGYGWQFVLVDVTGIEGAIFNTPDGSAPPGFPKAAASAGPSFMLYTPIDVQIAQAISGPATPGPGQFLVEGGTAGCYTMFVSPTPNVEIGMRYVFIVSDAPDASGKAALPVLQARFAWPVDAKGVVATDDGPMSLEDLAKIVLSATPSSAPAASSLPYEIAGTRHAAMPG